MRILIREALVSSARLQKLFARFTGAGGHVPLMMSLLAQGQEQGALRTDLPPLGLLVGRDRARHGCRCWCAGAWASSAPTCPRPKSRRR